MSTQREPYHTEAHELAERARALQQELNAAGFGPKDYKAELSKARRRIAEIETAAREVCQTQKIVMQDPGIPLPPHTKAMRALGNLIDFPGWWQL